jgi:hypothetical protein
MATRIFMSNGEQITVTDSIDAVAKAMEGGALTRLERPWGDEAIYVNPTGIVYMEAQEERAPNLETMDAGPPEAPAAPAGGPPPAGPPAGAGVNPGAAPGTPGGPPVQPPPRA